MDKEKEIEEMAKVIGKAQQPIEYDENTYSVTVYPSEKDIADSLIDAGYGNVKQAVKEFAEKLKETIADNTDKFINHMENVDPFGVSTEQIDEIYNKLYGADK